MSALKTREHQEVSANRLSRQEDWENIWNDTAPMLRFNPKKPWFSDIHKLLQKHLPYDQNMECLEVGCYPGTYLWYFNKYFGYKPAGIEYVPACVDKCKTHMKNLDLNADIHQADIFEFTPEKQWDVVFSVGLIEHFTDVEPVIHKHIDLIKPGGYLVLIIPNHSGLNGRIFKWIDEEKYNIHNRMNYEDIKRAVENIGSTTVIEGGYYGHMGFWNTDLYPWLERMGKVPYFLGRAAFYSLEYLAKFLLPDTAYLSPNCVMIAQKPLKNLKL